MLIKTLIVFLGLRCVVGYPYPRPQLEDDSNASNKSCLLSSFTTGVCRKFTDCPIALEMFDEQKSHNLPRCGFRKRIEVVCCPITSSRISSDGTTSTVSTTSTTSSRPTRFNTDWIVSPDIIESFTTSTTTQVPSFRETSSEQNRDGTRNPSSTQVGSRSAQACLEFSNEVTLELTLHILGGTDAKVGEFPHMAAINYEYDNEDHFNCGGSLISDRYVLTAAHCILRTDNRAPTMVRLGKVDLLGNSDKVPPQDYAIERLIVHPDYRSTQHYNDIALLRLRNRVRYTTNVYPACLFNGDTIPRGLVVTGWGITDVLQGDPSSTLKKATLDLVETNQCNETYAPRPDRRLTRGILKTQLCASGQRVTDACEGDSGGPIQVQQPGTANNMWSVVGVTSFGVSCGSRYPGVYARVSEYLEWIEQNVW